MKQFYKILLGFFIAIRICSVSAEETLIEVYKSPHCGCCEKWISHLEQNGFHVTSYDRDDMDSIKLQFNIPGNLQSCHTAVVAGYFIEGHVPAQEIKKLLNEKPDIKGLSVPGMPAGANVPGMETRAETATFDVLEVSKDGAKVYAHYE